MLTTDNLFDYQKKAINFQCTKRSSVLWLDMGLGKSAITLTSINHLIQTNYLNAVLVVAPIRVVRLVWRQEAAKWSHLNHLTFSVIQGTPDQRTRALNRKANIYLINYENVKWLSDLLGKHFLKKNKPLPFNGLIWDELSKCKNSNTKRVRSIRKLLPAFKWITGLTGTPASNGYKDLHGQYLVIDQGQRLGTSKTAFSQRFYYKVGPFKELPFNDTEDQIKQLISDITLEMSAADYNPLPDILYNDVEVELSDDLKEKYESMEKEMFIQLDSGSEVEMFNQASLTNRCLQFSNGAMYPVPGMPLWEPIHELKLEALQDIIEESGDKPIFCAYAYRSDAERIMTHFKDIKPINLTECKTDAQLNGAMEKWKSGQCKLMIAHPASCSHGVDGLQKNGNILVWFGLNWSLELYEQFNARIRRQGQGAPVICHRILMKDTLDHAQLIALENKANTQNSLRSSIKEYRLMKNSP